MLKIRTVSSGILALECYQSSAGSDRVTPSPSDAHCREPIHEIEWAKQDPCIPHKACLNAPYRAYHASNRTAMYSCTYVCLAPSCSVLLSIPLTQCQPVPVNGPKKLLHNLLVLDVSAGQQRSRHRELTGKRLRALAKARGPPPPYQYLCIIDTGLGRNCGHLLSPLHAKSIKLLLIALSGLAEL